MLRPVILLFFFLQALSHAAQFDPHTELRAIVSGDAEGVIERLSHALNSAAVQADPLLHARTLEMLGEQHYRLSDIGEADVLWKRALQLRIRNFGENSAEAGVGLAWQVRYHNYMSAGQLDHQEKAEELARLSIRLLELKGDVLPIEKVIAQRERAYAFKVYMSGDLMYGTSSVWSRPFFRDALRTASAHGDTIWIAQVLHDLGNTFTDELIPLRTQPALQRIALDSAKWYYARSIGMMERIGLADSAPVMMDHYTTSLVYQYAYAADSVEKAIGAAEEALRVFMRMAGIPGDADPYAHHPQIHDRAQMLELLAQIATMHEFAWYAGKGEDHLDRAIEVIDAAPPYWHDLVRLYRSKDIHKVIGSYAHNTFLYAANLHLTRYRVHRREEDLLAALQAMERNTDVEEQRERIRSGLEPLAMDLVRTNGDLRPAPGTMVLAYLHWMINAVIILGHDGMEVVYLDEPLIDTEHTGGLTDAFPVHRGPQRFKRYEGKAFDLYRNLLQEVVERRSERNVVVVPFGGMVHLPMEVLVSDTAGPGDPHFVVHDLTISYARDLSEALAPVQLIDGPLDLALTEHQGQADLPFAEKLIDRLAGRVRGATSIKRLDRSQLEQLLGTPGTLHLASHAHAPLEPDHVPYLLLTDERWSLNELEGVAVKRELIVLATCSSGKGRVFMGDGSHSIAHALLSDGAKSVVHTLWPVDDRATNEILGHMYDGLLEGHTASKALRSAKIRFLRDHQHDGLSHPFYWSGIVLTGRDVQLVMPRRIRTEWLGVSIAALVLSVLFYRRSRRSAVR